jgi:hypothetical protein
MGRFRASAPAFYYASNPVAFHAPPRQCKFRAEALDEIGTGARFF